MGLYLNRLFLFDMTFNLSPVLKRSMVLMLAVLTLDQATKQWIVLNFKEFEWVEVTTFFNIVRVHNPGAAFSFLANAGGWQHYFFITLAVCVSLYLLWEMRNQPNNRRLCLAHALVVSGALGNVIDRIRFKYVVDFLDIHVAGIHWPAFNVADSAICIGAVLLIWNELSSIKSSDTMPKKDI
jgi:signal peptidase II